MAIQDKTTLKSYFETDDTPTQAQFVDLIDTLLALTSDNTTAVDSINEATAENGVNMENVIHKDSKIAQGGTQTEGYIMRRYEVGNWNMNVSGSGTMTRTVVLNDALKFPTSVNVGIYPDSENTRIRSAARSNGTAFGCEWSVDANGDVVLSVESLGPFDTTGYSSLSINRGEVVVTKFSDL